MKTIFCLLPLVLAACASPSKSNLLKHSKMGSEKATIERSFSSNRDLKDLQDIKQIQKDRSAILNAKSRMNPDSVPELGAQARWSGGAKVQADYEELLGAYERNDMRAFNELYKKFLAQWSRSDFTDDAIYLKGMNELSQKNYGSALLAFNRVLKEFGNGNRAEAAQFAKAATLKRMNLKPLAAGAYRVLTHKYPGSPEAMRAQDEVKLLR